MLVMAAASVVQMTENSSARENATRVGSVGSEYLIFWQQYQAQEYNVLEDYCAF